MPIMRGEIYFVELGPTRGRELDTKRRPVAVMSVNAINRKPLVVTVVPGTTQRPGKPIYQTQLALDPTPSNGLSQPTVFECIQIKALDHSRFDRDPVGVLTEDDILRMLEVIKVCLGIVEPK